MIVSALVSTRRWRWFASDRRQARQALNYVKGLILDSPLIGAEVVSETAEGVTFGHRVVLEVHTTSFRSTRGYSYAAVILDELKRVRLAEAALLGRPPRA